MRRWRRLGFSLVELLVVIAVISVLTALLAPAVMQARETSRQSLCRARLRQIGFGLQQYHDVHTCFPPGRLALYDPRFSGPNPPCTNRQVDKGVLVALLPYCEQTAVFDAINHELSILGPENRTLHARVIGAYACPSDSAGGQAQDIPAGILDWILPGTSGPLAMGRTSYSFSFGTYPVRAFPAFYPSCRVPNAVSQQCNGVFHDRHPMRYANVTDGLAQTVFASEHATGTLSALESVVPSAQGLSGWWITGNLGDTLFTSFYPINAFRVVAIAAAEAQRFGASSQHPGGVHCLFGDGSVRFVSETVDSWPFNTLAGTPRGAVFSSDGDWRGAPEPGIWQRLTTRAGGEAVGVY